MFPLFEQIKAEAAALAASVTSSVPDPRPLGIAHGNNWSFPAITRAELAGAATKLVEMLDARGGESAFGLEAAIADAPARLAFLRAHTVPQIWGNSAVAVPTYLTTLWTIQASLEPCLIPEQKNVDAARLKAEADAVTLALKRANQRLRAIEATLNTLEPRTGQTESMVSRIEEATAAADRLPTDLADLEEAKSQIASILEQSQREMERHLDASKQEMGKILTVQTRATAFDEKLEASVREAQAVLERCESAYAASTSVGLAAAFSERSVALAKSMWMWVFFLALALASGLYFGIGRLNEMSSLLKVPSLSWGGMAINLCLSLLSVGGPIWFAWLATKQIGQRFRLAEDYAFKASISRAYEGYRRQAASIDKAMEARLLQSALDRLDELPLRLVEPTAHGSPWHEAATSPAIRDALKLVPNFAAEMNDLAKRAIEAISHRRDAPAGSAPSTPNGAE